MNRKSNKKIINSTNILCLAGSMLIIFSSPVLAQEITIPWNLTLPGFSPNADYAWDGDFSHTSSIGNDMESSILGDWAVYFNATADQSQNYSLMLPFQITIDAPDQVSPGQQIVIKPTVSLSGTPLFTATTTGSYSTSFTLDTPFTSEMDIPIPDVGYGGLSLDLNGSIVDTSSTSFAHEVRAITGWENDVWGNPLPITHLESLLGYEMSITTNPPSGIDAWNINADVLQTLSNIPALSVLGPASAVMDINVAVGMNILDRTVLDTNFLTGYYYYDGMENDPNHLNYGNYVYDSFLLNSVRYYSPPVQGYNPGFNFTIPDTPQLNADGEFEIDIFGLGLGYNTVFNYALQGNLGIDLVPVSGLFGTIDLYDYSLGEPRNVDNWITHWQYAEFLDAPASLAFSVVDGLPDETPDFIVPTLPDAISNAYTTDVTGNAGITFEIPGNDFTKPPTVTPSPIPEPATLLLIGSGLIGIAGFRKKYKI